MSDGYDTQPAALSEAGKEQVKLRSNWLNGISIATFAVGTLAPVTRALFERPTTIAILVSVAVAGICLLLSAIIHSAARQNLKELDR
ncbi:hypothetical protein [Jiella pacifica]|uniref:Uncharacterized protein n=1 Tax=Jiella pacifica TaxID=2696469 RepID=A0A6N9T2P7_9HYPH|nr:hypothetical protein [Jiella pacifica]NDW03278.1 hypothetical protein [Jiella pacifica]